ncbi:MAG: hypothetical protein IKP47_11805 [Ruminococcus sp.]|nr:hypothetical protein [Ruminococcus sp.]
MIKRKIEFLIWFLGTDNTRLAGYAGCSESNFSRLRSGSRRPRRTSPTIKKFAAAVCELAEEKGLTETLASGIGSGTQADELQNAITGWLFDDTIPPPEIGSHYSDSVMFGEKLDSVMSMVRLNNSRLSRSANVDPSYISRMRSGSRLPKNNPHLIGTICSVIVARAEEQDKLPELRIQIGCDPDCTEPELSRKLCSWLISRSSPTSIVAVRRLVDAINSVPEPPSPKLPSFDEVASDEILNEDSELYIGIEGVRRSTVRLLGRAARLGSCRMYFYTDQDLEWMLDDFTPKWSSLMQECVKHNVHFTIIHNIDRSISEMIEGISRWIPLYLSGLIDSYYCTKRQGERFCCSLYLNEGHEGISSFCARDSDREIRYHYFDSEEQLECCKADFDKLLSDSRPLFTIRKGTVEPEPGCTVIMQDGLRFCIGRSSVVINKFSDPKHLSFIFEHPLMCRAFKAYAESLNAKPRTAK